MTKPIQQILVLVDEPLTQADQKGIFSDSLKLIRTEVQLDVKKVENNLAAMCDTVSAMLDKASLSNSNYQLDSFEVKAEIGAEGEVKLIGGVKGKISGGVTLKFKRVKK